VTKWGEKIVVLSIKINPLSPPISNVKSSASVDDLSGEWESD